MSELNVRKAIGQLEIYLKTCSYTSSTVARIMTNLKPFVKFIEEYGPCDMRDVGREDLELYLRRLGGKTSSRTGRPLKKGYVACLRQAVNILFRSLYHYGLVMTNPMQEVGSPGGMKQGIKKSFEKQEMAGFLDSIQVNTNLGLRDRAMFELLYSSGLRVGELSNLDLGDVNLETRMLHVRCAKWGKDRFVPINEVAGRFLESYIGTRTRPEAPVFLGHRGRIGVQGIRKRFQKHLTTAGLSNKGFTVHAIRHSVAIHLLSNGADLRYVQDLLGHDSIETTVLYTNELQDNLKRIYKQYHPRENAWYKEVDDAYRDRIQRFKARLERQKQETGKKRRIKRRWYERHKTTCKTDELGL